MKIVVFGLGYVGLSNALVLAQKHEVVAVDVVAEKVEMLNRGVIPLAEAQMQGFLSREKLNLRAATEWKDPCRQAQLVVIAAPTNFDERKKEFDTSIVEEIIGNVRAVNKEVVIVIKSTIPVGFCRRMQEKGYSAVVCMPEFLREGKALYDNLHPSRIVVGDKGGTGKWIADVYAQCSHVADVPVVLMNSMEAEAVKLFANTYLAMRVAFFNELDSYAFAKNLNSSDIIKAVGLDPRIGTHYCNPSFGYGGYCLPKDTRQMKSNFSGVPSDLIAAIVQANQTRKMFIVEQIEKEADKLRGGGAIGIYRLVMKAGSSNFRSAAILDIIDALKKHHVDIIIYEPCVQADEFRGIRVVKDLNEFKRQSSLIVANRMAAELEDVGQKVFTRDVFGYE